MGNRDLEPINRHKLLHLDNSCSHFDSWTSWSLLSAVSAVHEAAHARMPSFATHQALVPAASSPTASHPSPLSMRSLPTPWLSSQTPDLASPLSSTSEPSSRYSTSSYYISEELARPKHMSESYTSFDLPLKSDRALLERYVNTSGGFSEFAPPIENDTECKP